MGPVGVYRKGVPSDTGTAYPDSPPRLAVAWGHKESEEFRWRSTCDLVTKDSAGSIVLPRSEWARARGAEVVELPAGTTLGTLVEADVAPSGPGDPDDVDPLVNIRPVDGATKPSGSWWAVEDAVPPAKITVGRRLRVLISSAADGSLEGEVLVSPAPQPFPEPPNPGWRSRLFVLSLPQSLIADYGGAPVVDPDAPERLAGVLLWGSTIPEDRYAVWCYVVSYEE